MTLSLWILMDWLGDFSPSINCKNYKNEITGIRLYKPEMPMESYALYLGTSDAFFGDGGQNIVCKNQSDCLYLETDDLLAVFNSIQDAFRHYSRWYDRCIEQTSSGCTLSALLASASEVFSTPLLIVDAAQIMVASSSNIGDFEDPEDLKSLSIHKSIPEEKLKRFNYLYKDSFYYPGIFPIPAGFFPTKSYCKHIFLNEERLGTIILKAPESDCTTGTLLLLELFAPLVDDWIKSNAGSASSFRLTAYFACTLRGDATTLPGLLRQLLLFGWSADCRKQIYVLRSPARQVRFDVHLLRRLVSDGLGVYVTFLQKQLVVLCNLDMVDQKAFSERIAGVISDDGYCGTSSFSFTDLDRLYDTYQQTLTALEHSPLETGQLYRCQDVAMRMVTKIVGEKFSPAMLHPALAAIRLHDEQNKTEYYLTLFTYLKNERRHQQTAAELFIHRNTLFLRLEKIQEICPLDLDDSEERFYLLFSFYQARYGGSKLPEAQPR